MVRTVTSSSSAKAAAVIRAAVPAAVACTKSTNRWIHGCVSVAGLDRYCAHRRVARRRMAWAVDNCGTNRHGYGSAWGRLSDGARAGCGPAAANLADPHRYWRLLGFHSSTRHDWGETR